MEEIMELICDYCHWPYIEDEEGLEGRCEECPIEKEIRKLIKEGTHE